MKFLGAILIVISCGSYGISFYSKCVHCIDFTNGLIDGFDCIKNDITFSMDTLPDTFFKAASFSGTAGIFFKKLSVELQRDGITLLQAFENCKNVLKNNTTKLVFNTVTDTILQLGKSDVDTQYNLLITAIEKLKICLAQQQKYCDKEGLIIKKIGFIAGVAISILLF